MRFDDTNPEKENAEFERVILEDVAMLGITYDHFSHTSDHFDFMLEVRCNILRQGTENDKFTCTAPILSFIRE